ncbi:MAG: hypothetical protein RJA52_582, partial [Bacteroidota bacterium]
RWIEGFWEHKNLEPPLISVQLSQSSAKNNLMELKIKINTKIKSIIDNFKS